MRKLSLIGLAIFVFGLNISKAQIIGEIINEMKPKKAFTGVKVLKKKDWAGFASYGLVNNMSTIMDLGGFGGFLSSSSSKKSFGPVNIGAEYFLNDERSIGLMFSYANAEQNYSQFLGMGNVSAKIKSYAIVGSLSQHLYTTDKIDPYLKGAVGIALWDGSYTYDNGTEVQPFKAPAPIAYHVVGGFRYFVSPKIAPFAELGYSMLKFTANLGITAKLSNKK